MQKKIRLAVIDDHPIVRRGVRETLAEEADFEVVAEGATADDAVEAVLQKRPDVVLLDVSMPGGGIKAAEEINKLRPETKMIMLTIREDEPTVRATLKAGARGYIAKGVDAAELIGSIRKVIAGGSLVSPGLAARIFTDGESQSSSTHATQTAEVADPLTERERQILELLGKGLSNEKIASALSLRENTIKHYMTPLFKKLGVHNRTEAAILARTRTIR